MPLHDLVHADPPGAALRDRQGGRLGVLAAHLPARVLGLLDAGVGHDVHALVADLRRARGDLETLARVGVALFFRYLSVSPNKEFSSL